MVEDQGLPDINPSPPETEEEPPSWLHRLKRRLIGRPRDLTDRSLFHRLSLIPFLAWVGLGADGLSSSCYGPEAAFKTLGQHTYLAIALAVVTATTVCIIAAAYSRVIEHFPHGGGGYVVATKLLGRRAGVVSGCALLVDYVLTIAVSIAASGDALFSFLPLSWQPWKLPVETLLIAGLIILNFRGVRESVLVLLPIFLLFLATHLILIAGGLIAHGPLLPATFRAAGSGFSTGLSTLGAYGMLLLFLHAYSLGGGTYTGIEAVSNGMAVMREPRVRNGKRTMLYMALSLAFTAGGLILCYLLWNVQAEQGKTMNAVLVERFVQTVPLGSTFVILTLLTEGALLIVAAQSGFVPGPRVLANMASDSWAPRRFAALSDRLTTQNGILLMGLTALMALWYTRGHVGHLVVMYSINVFITFSMTQAAMCHYYYTGQGRKVDWKRKISIHVVGLVMCLTILVITTLEKFLEGGWLTLLVTGGAVAVCFLIRGHYRQVELHLAKLDRDLLPPRKAEEEAPPGEEVALDPGQATAVILVGSYGGIGIHTLWHIIRSFPQHFKNYIFLSVGVIDSGTFKGEGEIEALQSNIEAGLLRYVGFCRRMNLPATYRCAVGTDVINEAERLCLAIREEFSRCVVFAGQLIFQRERWYQRILHNQTAFALQKRLQWHDMTMVILPVRVR